MSTVEGSFLTQADAYCLNLSKRSLSSNQLYNALENSARFLDLHFISPSSLPDKATNYSSYKLRVCLFAFIYPIIFLITPLLVSLVIIFAFWILSVTMSQGPVSQSATFVPTFTLCTVTTLWISHFFRWMSLLSVIISCFNML